MLPPIKYKLHPKVLEIQEQKRKRRQILDKARQKQREQREQLKEDRQEYMKQNKEIIEIKKQGIYDKKVTQRNKIREEDLGRAQRIANKKSEILMKLIPQRRQFIDNLRTQYLDSIHKNDEAKQNRIKKMVADKLEQESKKFRETFTRQQKLRNNQIIDTNEGACVLCLVEEAQIFMTACKHLISCKDCEFMLRMNKKCPLCRTSSKYENINERKKVRKNSRVKKEDSFK